MEARGRRVRVLHDIPAVGAHDDGISRHGPTVFVAGELRKWRGTLVGVDAEATRALVDDIARATAGRVGPPGR